MVTVKKTQKPWMKYQVHTGYAELAYLLKKQQEKGEVYLAGKLVKT